MTESITRRETLRLLGALGTTAAVHAGTVGAVGETGRPARTPEEFDPLDTELGQWCYMREQVFDSQAFHYWRRGRTDPHTDFEWPDGGQPDPHPYFAWSWPEIVRNSDDTTLLRPSGQRNSPHTLAGGTDETVDASYPDSQLQVLDEWTSRKQLRFEYPAVLDLLDVMYMPTTRSWRYSFVYVSGGEGREYYGSPSHAHDPESIGGAEDPPVVHGHALDLSAEHDEPLSFITAQGKDGIPHAIGAPIPASNDLTLEELERELDVDLPDPDEADEETVMEALVPSLEESTMIAAMTVLAYAGRAARLSNPTLFAAEIVVRAAFNYFFAPDGEEPPDQVDNAEWSYDGGEDEDEKNPRSHAMHARIWAVDVPASPGEIGNETTFRLEDSYLLEHRVTDGSTQGGNYASTYDESPHLPDENPIVRTEGRFRVTLPVLKRPADMSQATRQYRDVRPYCHPQDDGDCLYKAYGALPDVTYEQEFTPINVLPEDDTFRP